MSENALAHKGDLGRYSTRPKLTRQCEGVSGILQPCTCYQCLHKQLPVPLRIVSWTSPGPVADPSVRPTLPLVLLKNIRQTV